MYSGPRARAQQLAVLSPLTGRLPPGRLSDEDGLQRVRQLLSMTHKRFPKLTAAGNSLFLSAHWRDILRCPPGFCAYKPKLRSCEYAGICPFCWARRVGETWDRLRPVVFDYRRPLYQIGTTEAATPISATDPQTGVARYWDSRRATKSKRESVRASHCGSLSFLTLARMPSQQFVLRRRTLILTPLGSKLPRATRGTSNADWVAEPSPLSVPAAVTALAWAMRYPPFLIHGEPVSAACCVDAQSGLRQLTVTGILRGGRSAGE